MKASLCKLKISGFRVCGLGFQGLGFRVCGFGGFGSRWMSFRISSFGGLRLSAASFWSAVSVFLVAEYITFNLLGFI